jgi:hypothetical protein
MTHIREEKAATDAQAQTYASAQRLLVACKQISVQSSTGQRRSLVDTIELREVLTRPQKRDLGVGLMGHETDRPACRRNE